MKNLYFDLTSQQFKRDPFPTFAHMRQTGALVRTKLPLIGQAWVATTFEAVTRILREQKDFVLEPANAGKKQMVGMRWWMPSSFRVLAKNMLTQDEPHHRRLRGLVEQAFLRQSVEALRGSIASLADRFLDQLQRETKENREGIDLIAHFARPFPLAVICTLLGLPDEDRPRFTRWARRLTKTTSAFGMLTALPGIWKLLRYLKRQFQLCRRQPCPGLISALVEVEQEGKRLSEDELLAMAFLLLLAGHETTVHLIGGGVLALLQHDDQKAELMSDWSKSTSAVEEILRYVSPVQITKPRYASRAMQLYGRTIKRGDILVALLASANSDPAQFTAPERFDINRHPNPHVAFGTGIHVCLGSKLARLEVAVALERLFAHFADLKLAGAPSKLRWLKILGLRALASLPVTP